MKNTKQTTKKETCRYCKKIIFVKARQIGCFVSLVEKPFCDHTDEFQEVKHLYTNYIDFIYHKPIIFTECVMCKRKLDKKSRSKFGDICKDCEWELRDEH